ncbi:MAG: NAD-binding protein [Acidobacteriota bacterium]|nr:NAD-binding protein [Acidobacteriota bacterium]
MSGHVIVCGMGDVGYRVVELLHRLGESVQVVTAQARPERRLAAEAHGISVAIGDARAEELLLEAGLLEAKALLAATDNDLANIEIALDARRLRPDLPIVLRLFDQELARQLEPVLEVRRALNMAALAAPSFAASALGESILVSFPIGEVPFVVGRQTLSDGGPLSGCQSLSRVAQLHRLQALLREHPEGLSALPPNDEPVGPADRLTLLGRKEDWDCLFGAAEATPRRGENVPWRGRLRQIAALAAASWRAEPILLRFVLVGLAVLIPATALFFHFQMGFAPADAIYFTVTSLYGSIDPAHTSQAVKIYEVLLVILGSISVATLSSLFTAHLVGSRLRRILGGQPMPRGGHVIVVGMGRVGFRILHELLAVGVPVIAIDADPSARLLPSARTIAPVVTGDARAGDILSHARLSSARAVVAATSDDAVNLSISLVAKRFNPRVRTVSRLFDADFARKVESALGVDAALSASLIAAPTFAAAILAPHVAKAVIVRDRLLVLLERKAGAEWEGLRPAELRFGKGIHLLMRGGKLVTETAAAVGEAPLQAEEEVLAVFCRTLAPTGWSARQAPAR